MSSDKGHCKIQKIWSDSEKPAKELHRQYVLLEKFVQDAYKEEFREYENKVKPEIKAFLDEWTTGPTPINYYRTNLIERVGPIPELEINEFESPKGVKEGRISWIKPDCDWDGVVHKNELVPTGRIDIGKKYPRMLHWVHITQSIVAKDQLRLTHMPFFENGMDDSQEYEKFAKLFTDGIHGFTKNWKYINDYLLYKVMRRVLEYGYTANVDVFYYTFYRLWPNKFSQRQYSEVFPKLCARYAEEGFDWQSLEPWKPKPEGMYGLNPYMEKPAENVQNPTCFACLEYLCPVHGLRLQIAPEIPGGDIAEVFLPLPGPNQSAVTCGGDCWKTIDPEEIMAKLTPDEEEIEDRRVKIYLDKGKLMEMSIPEGSMIATLYMYDKSGQSFCQFVHENLHGKTDDSDKIRTCRDAYSLIMGLAEYVTDRRIQMGQTQPMRPYKERYNAFRNIQMRNHQQATKAREAALQERANSEGKTLQQVRKEEEREFMRKHGRAMNEKVMICSTRPFVPCRHEGTCKDDPDCSCQENGVCSHLCKCSIDCPQRFPGCICAPGTCRNQHCACFRANWECNPNTCKNCNCETIDGTGDEVICGNFPLTRMVQKRLYVAPSRISGFGLFLMENVEKDDLVVEYVGEKISDEETERRGAIYDTFKCSYILGLGSGGAIDAFKVGNLSRFANNNSVNPTLYAKAKIVNGEHRIGFYAIDALKAFTELTFNYDYHKEHAATVSSTIGKKGRRSSKPSTSSRPSTSLAMDYSDFDM
ncbi:hypothetical protein GCK72_025986 [Caenorhabditis remanei]|uniref:[histone H3]-lysine(27) N-trimethyltransferase n=1 Tax=Caenorhabditis remanei TaxID=31234 RepID=A0A6A5G3F0_CAERE|nr:hypothetical protein GCK72_025986 [Caenorhabditis remanei]KAF1749518.1 hypothetical protein GCK72_025986 [Caenorhabditis remanei]